MQKSHVKETIFCITMRSARSAFYYVPRAQFLLSVTKDLGGAQTQWTREINLMSRGIFLFFICIYIYVYVLCICICIGMSRRRGPLISINVSSLRIFLFFVCVYIHMYVYLYRNEQTRRTVDLHQRQLTAKFSVESILLFEFYYCVECAQCLLCADSSAGE